MFKRIESPEEGFVQLKYWSDIVGVFTRLGFLYAGLFYTLRQIDWDGTPEDAFGVMWIAPLLACIFIYLLAGALGGVFLAYLITVLEHQFVLPTKALGFWRRVLGQILYWSGMFLFGIFFGAFNLYVLINATSPS